MKNIKLSVVLAVFNEQENLAACLSSVQGLADEIVISDGGSTDATVEIAKKYHAQVLHFPNQTNFHINKNNALKHATGEWILQLDADEVVSPGLAEEIKKIVNSPLSTVNYAGYWVNRRNWFLNRFLTKGGQYPDPTLRLYKRGLGKLPAQDVHEQARVEGQTGSLKGDLLHYRDKTFAKYLQGFNRYSSFLALQMKDQKLPTHVDNDLYYLLILPLFTFLKLYIRHRGYVDGFPGFVFALYSGLIHGVAYIKYKTGRIAHK